MVYLELAAVTVLWGLVPLIMQWSSQDLHAGSFNLIRYGLSVFFISLLMTLRGKTISIALPSALKLIVLGALTMFPFSYFFLLGVKSVDISVAGIIQGTAPALTVVATVALFRELPSRKVIVALGMTYASLVLFLMLHTEGESSTSSWRGVGYISVAILCLALYTTLSKSIHSALNNWSVTLYVCIGVFAACLPVSVYEQWWLGGQHLRVTGVLGTVYMSLFATVISLLLYTKAARIAGPFQASIFTNLIPIVIVASGVIVLGEKITGLEKVAIALTVTGVYLTIHFDRQERGSRKDRGEEAPGIAERVTSDG